MQVATYHMVSVKINAKAPTPGVVSRGIGLEGFCSILAGLWGSGTGSTTLTENVHTVDITKIASRRVLEVGAGFMIFFSFIGNGTRSFLYYFVTHFGYTSISPNK